jgi:hypothetical protein
MPIGIKLPLADHLGDLVWAVDLAQTGERPKDLKCVECSEPVLLRHGEQRQPHFAHRVAVGCTAGESALHRSAIRVIVDGILRAASDGRTYPFPIVCEFCDASRLGNLSRTVGLSIEIDRHLTDAVRPDILVRTADGSPGRGCTLGLPIPRHPGHRGLPLVGDPRGPAHRAGSSHATPRFRGGGCRRVDEPMPVSTTSRARGCRASSVSGVCCRVPRCDGRGRDRPMLVPAVWWASEGPRRLRH